MTGTQRPDSDSEPAPGANFEWPVLSGMFCNFPVRLGAFRTPPGYAGGGSTKDHPSDTLRVHIGHGGGAPGHPGAAKQAASPTT